MTKGYWLGRKAGGEGSDHEFYTSQNYSVKDLEMLCVFGRLGEKVPHLALTPIISHGGRYYIAFHVFEKSRLHFTLLHQCNPISSHGIVHRYMRAEFGLLCVPSCPRLLRTFS